MEQDRLPELGGVTKATGWRSKRFRNPRFQGPSALELVCAPDRQVLHHPPMDRLATLDRDQPLEHLLLYLRGQIWAPIERFAWNLRMASATDIEITSSPTRSNLRGGAPCFQLLLILPHPVLGPDGVTPRGCSEGHPVVLGGREAAGSG